MAARAKRPAAGVAAARSVGEEGGGWLCRLVGVSLGTRSGVAVYALLPRLPSRTSLGRLATVLSADPDFVMTAAYAERLPFAVAGYAVADLGGGRVYDGIPEEARRRLEGWRARRALLFGALGREVRAEVLAGLLREAAGLGADVEVRAVLFAPGEGLPGSAYTLVEAKAERPLDPSGLRRLEELAEDLLPGSLVSFPPQPERELLERAGLWALARMVPELYWIGGREGLEEPKESHLTFYVEDLPPLGLPKHEEGARGGFRSWVAGAAERSEAVSVWVRRLGSGDLAALERLLRASEEARRAWWRRLVDGLAGELERAEREARGILGLPAPPCPFADEVALLLRAGRGDAKVWEEGGRVKVWLMPPLDRRLLERLAAELRPLDLTPADYFRALSERLGREVELVGEEPPFCLSPEVDAAAEELLSALRELVGSA